VDAMTAREPAHKTGLQPRRLSALVDDLSSDLEDGTSGELVPVPTRFQPLDNVLGGGFRPGELALVGGMPGVGKTIMTLQMARNMARDGKPVVYLCYEHEEWDLFVRLLAMEMGENPDARKEDTEKVRLRIRDAAATGGESLYSVLKEDPVARAAYSSMQRYSDNLQLMKASGRHTAIEEIEEYIRPYAGGKAILFLDYLQKIALKHDVQNETEKVTEITEELKELALTYQLPIVTVVAADKEGLKSPRLRLHHLRGSSALMYEADVILIMNHKFDAVAKVHRAYDPIRAKSFHEWAILSVEKNRGGPPGIDMEFHKDFMHFRFELMGGIVSEKLYDEREDPE
jgi:replicative DNA helicase